MSAVLEPRQDPGKWASAVLAISVHALLLIVLIYGLRWQSHAPATVSVDLYRNLPVRPITQPPPPMPKPKLQPRPLPKPPPKPEVKPTPPPPKPDIAIKEKPKPKPKVESRPKPKPKPKPRQEQKRAADKAEKKMMEQTLKHDEQQLAQLQANQELAQLKAAQAAAARSKALADYTDRIRAKIRGNIVMPPDVQGNPSAKFDVTQLPGGVVLEVKLKKSSGNAAYDDAVKRAILKASPLPKPDSPSLFERVLNLTFCPQEDSQCQ